MALVVAAVVCGWLVGLVLAGMLVVDVAFVGGARQSIALRKVWASTPVGGMLALTIGLIVLPGSLLGLFLCAVYLVVTAVLGQYPGATVFIVFSGLVLTATAIGIALAPRWIAARRGRTVVIGMAIGIIFGIVYPLLAV